MTLVDGAGRIVHTNAAGQAMLSEGTVLRSARGKLAATDAEERALQDVIAATQDGDAAVGGKGMVLHAGPRSDFATGAVVVPIFQTAAYEFRSTEHAANLFALRDFGNIYSRIMNPTCDALKQKMAALEGGAASLAVSSGLAASALATQNLCRPGDNVVSSTDLYGGTWNLFANTLPSMGISARFVDPADPQAFRRATDERTRAFYAETLPNPKLTAFPIAEVAAIGREFGVPLIMDNTAAPVDLPPPRARRSDRRALHHEVYRPPWHRDRRHHRRWGQFRLVSAPPHAHGHPPNHRPAAIRLRTIGAKQRLARCGRVCPGRRNPVFAPRCLGRAMGLHAMGLRRLGAAR